MYVCVPIYTVYYGFVGVPNLKLVRKNHNPSKKRQLKTILSRPKLHETSFLIPPSSSLHELFIDFKKPFRHERRIWRCPTSIYKGPSKKSRSQQIPASSNLTKGCTGHHQFDNVTFGGLFGMFQCFTWWVLVCIVLKHSGFVSWSIQSKINTSIWWEIDGLFLECWWSIHEYINTSAKQRHLQAWVITRVRSRSRMWVSTSKWRWVLTTKKKLRATTANHDGALCLHGLDESEKSCQSRSHPLHKLLF